jgi:hypothetical protein
MEPAGSRPGYAYVSDSDREAVLGELTGVGWAIASDWLQCYVGFDQLALHLLKHVGKSASRLDDLAEDAVLNIDEVRKEVQTYCTLIAALRDEE